MSAKTLSPAETIAQLTRRTARVAPAAGPRVHAADGATRRSPARGDAVWRHRFRVGDLVTLLPNRYGANRLGRFKVTSLLPQEHGVNQYRLKSATDGHERVATEEELN